MTVRRLAPCGTRTAYARHLRWGEEPCDACREANNARGAEYQRESGLNRARQRAFGALGRRYPEALKALHDEEMAKEPVRGVAAWNRARQRAFTRLTHRYPEAWTALFAREKAQENRS